MDYIFKPISFILIIALGYILKRCGVFGKDDHRLMSKIMINITLPCTIIQAFDGFERDGRTFTIVGLGFFCAFLPIFIMYLTTDGVEKKLRRLPHAQHRRIQVSAASPYRWFRRFSETSVWLPRACSIRATR